MQRESGENGGLVFRWDSVGEGLSIGSAGTGPSTIIYYLKIRHKWTGQEKNFWAGQNQGKSKNVRCRARQGRVEQNNTEMGILSDRKLLKLILLWQLCS